MQKLNFIFRRSIWVIISILLLSSAKTAYADALDDLDNAKRPAEFAKAEEEISKPSLFGHMRVKRYIKDRSKDGRKRFIAFRAMNKDLPQYEKEKELIQALKEESDPQFKVSAVLEMATSTTSLTNDELRYTVNNAEEHPYVQVAAGSSLAYRGDGTGKGRALKAVMNGEPWADFGIVVLEDLRATDTLPTLTQQYQSNANYYIKNDCRLATLRIQLAVTPRSEQLRLLKEALLEDGYFEVRQWAGIHLGDIGDNLARMVLVDALKAPNVQGKQAAYKGLIRGIEKGYWTEAEVNKWVTE